MTALEDKYHALLIKYSSIEDSETLRKYKILKEAFSIGRKLHGHKFNLHNLSNDLDLPYTTTKRIFALSKANNLTWKKIKDKKISPFRVAYILSTRDVTYQDELIDLAIEKNLTTYDIKKLRIKDYKDIAKARLTLSVQQGFARKDSCYASFIHTLERFDNLFLIDKNQLPESKLNLLKTKLDTLKKDITKFVEKLND